MTAPKFLSWWSQAGSNRRPPACKAGALPAELWPLDSQRELVGLGGFEPPTSPLSGVRSNQLSYRPKSCDVCFFQAKAAYYTQRFTVYKKSMAIKGTNRYFEAMISQGKSPAPILLDFLHEMENISYRHRGKQKFSETKIMSY